MEGDFFCKSKRNFKWRIKFEGRASSGGSWCCSSAGSWLAALLPWSKSFKNLAVFVKWAQKGTLHVPKPQLSLSKMISNQVWVCVVPKEEAVTRIMERDSKSREEAERRVASQLSNAERVAQVSRRNSSQSTFNKQSNSLNLFSGKHGALHSLASRCDPKTSWGSSEEVTKRVGEQWWQLKKCWRWGFVGCDIWSLSEGLHN